MKLVLVKSRGKVIFSVKYPPEQLEQIHNWEKDRGRERETLQANTDLWWTKLVRNRRDLYLQHGGKLNSPMAG